MKAIEVTEFGGPEQLRVVNKARPEPGPGQILIEVKAAGLNFADILIRAGQYPLGPKPPFVPGMEAAGIVAAVGEGVTTPAVGTRVMSFVSSGGYAEYALADAAGGVPLPNDLDFAPATALLVQGLTAYFLFKHAARLQPGQSVLISAAAGGVGSLAVQIAKLMGAGIVIGTASTPEKRKLVLSLGADAAIDYTQPGWTDAVKEATDGKGVDIFMDSTGDAATGLKPLAQGGIWVIYGGQSGAQGSLSGAELMGILFQSQMIRGFTLYEVMADPQALAAAMREMIGWVTSGQLRIEMGARFPLAQAAQAHEAISGRKTTGKVVLEP
jgi:NADPH2:quinone reductase